METKRIIVVKYALTLGMYELQADVYPDGQAMSRNGEDIILLKRRHYALDETEAILAFERKRTIRVGKLKSNLNQLLNLKPSISYEVIP